MPHTGSANGVFALFRELGIYFAWLVAIVATIGSLYYSEVRLFVPCELCWYQRILMYPLVILLGIASFKGDRGIVSYALPFSALGVLVAAYHYALQKVPGLAATSPCRVGVPCDAVYVNYFGFITIPFMALIAFTAASALLLAAARGVSHTK